MSVFEKVTSYIVFFDFCNTDVLYSFSNTTSMLLVQLNFKLFFEL